MQIQLTTSSIYISNQELVNSETITNSFLKSSYTQVANLSDYENVLEET